MSKKTGGAPPSTLTHHGRTTSAFLAHIGYETHPTRLATLERQDLDAFVRAVGPRQSRASLQHVVAHLRAFLRFLASAGEIPPGLDTQIDTPRVYRGEKLPRALPWNTVRALLETIDRTSSLGRRDYAIFLLMATYGLRACEVVTLTIDDVEWRAERLRIAQRKTRGSLWLPLTDEVGTALLDYLRHGRPALNVRRQRVPFQTAPPRSYRELFLRGRTPTGVLKPTAVTEAFQAWSKRSGLQVRYWGIRPSFGLLKEPETNGVVERWNRTLKEQAVYGRVFQNLADVRAAVAEFVERYNRCWRLEKLAYRTPLEAREEYELRQAA